jgi:hypothetical protein
MSSIHLAVDDEIKHRKLHRPEGSSITACYGLLSTIDTAPTDKKDILCWNGNCWFVTTAEGKYTSCTGYVNPTHWCELPKAP